MIFYFTGTGNSLQVAKRVAQNHNENLLSIASAINNEKQPFEYALKDNEVIGLIFPIYAWGPPSILLEFVDKLKLTNYQNNYTFAIATCGENIGNGMKVLDAQLKKSRLKLDSGFSIVMPNNYIIIGNVDSKEIERKKLQAAEETLKHINKIIQEKQRGIFEVEKGPFPGLLTSVINPLFNKHAINTKKFFANDSCIGCRICEKVCSCENIKVADKPKWGNQCVQCLACIHFCPTQAIQYGKGTEKKGRYKHPDVDANELCKRTSL